MTVLIDTEAGPVAPPDSPPRRSGRRRALSALRLVIGWLLLLVAVVVPFAPVETSTEPVVDCGASAVQLLFGGATGPPASDCRTEATNTFIGLAVIALLPGIALVAGRRLRRRARAGRETELARMEQSGVWRFLSVWRWSAAIVGALPIAGLSLAAVISGDVALWILGAILGGPWAAYCYLAACRPRVELTPAALVVTNPLGRHSVAWPDVVAVHPGYWGTRLTRRDGSTLNLWAGQKTNWAVWRGRRSRADAMCEAIAQQARLTTGNLDPTIQLADPARSDNRARGRRNMLIGLAAYGAFLVLRFGLLR